MGVEVVSFYYHHCSSWADWIFHGALECILKWVSEQGKNQKNITRVGLLCGWTISPTRFGVHHHGCLGYTTMVVGVTPLWLSGLHHYGGQGYITMVVYPSFALK